MILALLAAAVALPDYQPDDAFIFSDGRVERVVAVDGDTVTWSGLGASRYRRSRNPVAPILGWSFAGGTGRRVIGAGAAALWPLAPGRSARFSVMSEVSHGRQARRSIGLWSCRVGDPASTTVPAGTFATLPIDCERYSAATMRLAERVHWDWSDEVGHYVRRTVRLYFDGSVTTITLVATLAGEDATPARLAALSRMARDQNKIEPKKKTSE